MKERFHRLPPLILVVEDHPDWNEALQSLLARDGYRTAGARDGIEALSLATALEPDLILLGMALPVMDGLEFLREYGRDSSISSGGAPKPRVPVLAWSSIPSYLLQAVDLGAAMALESPVVGEQLLDRVDDLIHRRPSSRLPSPARARPRSRAPQPTQRELQHEFLESLVRIFSADAVTVGVVRDGQIEQGLGTGPRAESCLRQSPGNHDSPCQLVLSSGQWLGVGDLDENPLLATSRWRQESGMRSYAGAPLLASDGAIWGTLALHFASPRVHGHSEKHLLLAFAELVSSDPAISRLPQEFLRRMLPALVARSISNGESLSVSGLGDELEAWSLIRDLEAQGEVRVTGTSSAA
jgi:CheY-like chemotaxis protein